MNINGISVFSGVVAGNSSFFHTHINLYIFHVGGIDADVNVLYSKLSKIVCMCVCMCVYGGERERDK